MRRLNDSAVQRKMWRHHCAVLFGTQEVRADGREAGDLLQGTQAFQKGTAVVHRAFAEAAALFRQVRLGAEHNGRASLDPVAHRNQHQARQIVRKEVQLLQRMVGGLGVMVATDTCCTQRDRSQIPHTSRIQRAAVGDHAAVDHSSIAQTCTGTVYRTCCSAQVQMLHEFQSA